MFVKSKKLYDAEYYVYLSNFGFLSRLLCNMLMAKLYQIIDCEEEQNDKITLLQKVVNMEKYNEIKNAK